MSEIVILACHNCDSQLEIGVEIERFACASCGSQYRVQRGGGLVALIPLVDEGAEIASRSAQVQAEIKALENDLWYQREGIPQEAVYQFFVMLDDVLYSRRGTKRKRPVLGLHLFSNQDQSQWEEDVRQTLNSLTVDELNTLLEKCVALSNKGITMTHYQAKLERLKQLKQVVS